MRNRVNPENAITTFIGRPGTGKSTTTKLLITEYPDVITAIDADSCISERGVKALHNGTWGDDNRRDYLRVAATKVVEAAARPPYRAALFDAMTTRWMRDFYEQEVRKLTNTPIAWVLVERTFAPGELEQMVEERVRENPNHPMQNVSIFLKYYNAFEPMNGNHLVLRNPGPEAGEAALLFAINSILEKIYGQLR